MSEEYKPKERVPSNVLRDRLMKLSDAVTKGPGAVNREFDMRVPAERDRDADFVLMYAADRIGELESALREVEAVCGEKNYSDEHVGSTIRCMFAALNRAEKGGE